MSATHSASRRPLKLLDRSQESSGAPVGGRADAPANS